MSSPLIPCERCARHVFADARRCPFCEAPLPERVASDAPVPSLRGMSRSAIIALGTTLALSECRSSRGGEESSIAQPYGVPIPPQPDVQTIAQPYGVPIPPPDVTPPEAPQIATGAVLGWELLGSANPLTMSQRASFRLTVAVTNRGRGTADPGRDVLRFRVNGQDSMALDMAFGNGLRSTEWSRLPPGRRVTDARDMGETIFPRPGEYTLELVAGEQVVATLRVRVRP